MAEFKAASASPFRANLYPNFDSRRLTKSTSCFSFLPPLPTGAEIVAVGEKVSSSASEDPTRSVFRTGGLAANKLDCVANVISSTTTKGTPNFANQSDRRDLSEILGWLIDDDIFGSLLES